MTNPFQDAVDKILNMVKQHEKFLTKNPKVLAWLMRQYDELHAASRYAGDADPNKYSEYELGNPKNQLIDEGYKLKSKYANLIYEAWGFSLFYGEPQPLKTRLEWKKNKTMDDFYKILLNKKYLYKSLFPDKNAVLNRILCNPYTGSKWNKQGFINESELIGNDGLDLSIFFEYDKAKIPNKIKKECDWLKNKFIQKALVKLKKQSREFDKEKRESKKALAEVQKYLNKHGINTDTKKPFTFNSLGKGTLFSSMPKNAHKSFLKAKEEICHLVLNSPYENSENKAAARKALLKLN